MSDLPTSGRPAADLPPAEADRDVPVGTMVAVLAVIAAATVVFDVFHTRYVKFPIEAWPGAWGIWGFLAAVVLVGAAGLLRRLAGRPEDDHVRRR